MKRVYVSVLFFLAFAACSGSLQGPPEFEQTYGTVDEPCTASKTVSARCTAHVYLVNHGGEGIALATVLVPLSAHSNTATAARRANSNDAKCGGYIPATPNGGEADLECAFEVPAGRTIAGAPVLQAVNYSATAAAASSDDGLVGAASLGLAAFAGAIALIALLLAVAGRGRASAGRVASKPEARSRRGRDDQDDEDW